MSMQYDLKKDVTEALVKYRDLNYISPDILKGDIALFTQDGEFLHTFKVEINYPEKFPYCFPLVKEIGGDIPKTADRHVFTDSHNLCLGVKAEELALCRFGISTTWFLDRVLVPRLAEEYLVMNGEDYQREYSHGLPGYWEYYSKLFCAKDKKLIMLFFEMALRNALPKGNSSCPCNNGKKFSKCHRKFIYEFDTIMQQTDPSFWIGEYKLLLNYNS